LLEDRLARLPVLLDDVALLPGHLVIGVHPRRGVDPLDLHALAGALAGTCACSGGFCHCDGLPSPWCCSLLIVVDGTDSAVSLLCGDVCRGAQPGGILPRGCGSVPVASRSARSSVIAASKSSRLSNAW